MASRSISISSILLSYFLVAGGIALGLVLFVRIGGGGKAVFYGCLALGGAVGGFIASRGSRDSTILEPAIGGLLVIASLIGIFVGTDVGSILWHVAKDEIVEAVGLAAAAAALGAIGGALLSEKLVSGYAQNPLEWFVLVGFNMFGACLVALLVVAAVAMHGGNDSDTGAGVYFGTMALGALLGGLAAGSSAPRRILLLTMLGSIAGVMGFYLLCMTLPRAEDDGGKLATGFFIIGVIAGLIAMIGAAIGWRTVGRRQAAALAARAKTFE